MITHIMINEKFIKDYIEFINKNFEKNEHIFLIIDGIDEKKIPVSQAANIKRFKTFKSKNKLINLILKPFFKIKLYIFLLSYTVKTKKIYFHGLFNSKFISFLYIFKFLLKKSNWIIWGSDLYSYTNRDYTKKRNRKRYKKEDFVKKNFKYISALVPEDYNVAKKYYKVEGNYQRAIYISNNPNIQIIPNVKSELYIQIGNSADPSNNHKEILDILRKFKDEKIKIFAILSYGNENYGKEVAKYGKEIFGDRFIPVFEFLPLDKYWKYISDIDILIFNHKRQQGLGNINMLCYLEKKIYLRNDISSWNYLTKELELKLNPFNNIENENFEEFRLNNSIGNRKKIENTVFSNEYMRKIWEKNFEN